MGQVGSRNREFTTGRPTIGYSQECEELGHIIDVVYPNLGIGFCRRCPGMQINLKEYAIKMSKRSRQKYGCAEGDIIMTTTDRPGKGGYLMGQIFRVVALFPDDVPAFILANALDESGNEKWGDEREAKIRFDDFELVKKWEE